MTREKGSVVPGGQTSEPETPKAGNGEYAVRASELFIHVMPKCEHDWSGAEVELENGSSRSCAKCGMLAINDIY